MSHYNESKIIDEELKIKNHEKRTRKIGITLTYYENPATLHILSDWEHQMFKQVIIKRIYENSVIFYLLDKTMNDKCELDYEVLICIPTGQIQDTMVIYQNIYHMELSRIPEINYTRKFSYRKCLVFGMVCAAELKFISEMINKFNKEWLHEEV